MSKLPHFETEEEAGEWFTTPDTAPYMDELEEVTEKIRIAQPRPSRESVGLRLRADYLEAIKKTVECKSIPYQSLIQMWLEALRQESPELVP